MPPRIVINLFIAIGLILGGLWVYDRWNHIYIYDARLAADVHGVGSTVPGRLERLLVSSGDRVVQGQVLAVIDPRRAELELNEMRQQLQAAEYQNQAMIMQHETGVLTRQESLNQAMHALQATKNSQLKTSAEMRLAETELQRLQELAGQDYISTSQLEIAKADKNAREAENSEAQDKIKQREAELRLQQASLAQGSIEKLEIKRLEVELERMRNSIAQAERNLGDHSIKSPIDGVIDNSFGLIGENTLPGQRLFIIHDPDQVWVSANIKEVYLHQIELGQKVDVSLDSWSDQTLTGTLARIADAATNQSALLPSTNPGGNFTKVTQRVELKILLDDIPEGLELRPGTLVEVVIPINTR